MTKPLLFPVIFQNIYLCDLSDMFMVLMVKTYIFLVLIMIVCCYIKLPLLPEVHIYVSFLVGSLKKVFLRED